jgi:hypothetical protein
MQILSTVKAAESETGDQSDSDNWFTGYSSLLSAPPRAGPQRRDLVGGL